VKKAVLDIETIPAHIPDEVQFQDDQERADLLKKLSLDAATARIVCIGVILLDEFAPLEVSAFVNPDEAQLLSSFWNYVAKNRIHGFITHNGLSFDLPFLWRRSVVCQVKPTMKLDLRRYSTGFVFDTMSVWSNWEHRNSISLGRLAEALGLEGKSGNGSEVLSLWMKRDLDGLTRYCLDDCRLTYECYCRMNFETSRTIGDLLPAAAESAVKSLLPISSS
jgi:3'-5' exonuclease